MCYFFFVVCDFNKYLKLKDLFVFFLNLLDRNSVINILVFILNIVYICGFV